MVTRGPIRRPSPPTSNPNLIMRHTHRPRSSFPVRRIVPSAAIVAAGLWAIVIPPAIAQLTELAPTVLAAAATRPSRIVTTMADSADAALAGPRDIVIDGNIADWPADSAMLADGDFVYFRFTIPEREFTLQGAPSPVCLYLDTDANAETGDARVLAALATEGGQPVAMGVDVVVEFSPKMTGRRGVGAYRLDAAGARTAISPDDLGVVFAPTYAARWYEGRISRHGAAAVGIPEAGIASSGALLGAIATLDDQDMITGCSDAARVTLPRIEPHRPLGTIAVPDRPADAIRVVSYNILRSKPMSDPGAFRGVFAALKPDIVLLQEWEAGDAAAVTQWFNSNVGGEGTWHVVKAAGDLRTGGGVAIASRYPAEAIAGADGLRANAGNRSDADDPGTPVRFVAARITTPQGEFIVGSAHLKSAGHKDSSEDRRRIAEARAINAVLKPVFENADAKPSVRVIGGDMNLVGSRPPLDVLRASLNNDASDLAVAKALVLGDRTVTTWRDPKTPFTPGRLDYLLYSDASADVVNAFVLDAGILTDDVLARAGLKRDDCNGSDHLPVVIDLRPRR